jgi:pimeloyl-ACP methyl ester carboxylesterase
MIHPDRLQDEELIEAIRDMILRNSVADFLGQMHALLKRNDQTGILPGIKQRVLLVAGEADGHSPPAQHEAMAALIPRSQLEIVANAGHMVTMEKPEEVSKILLDWFTDNEN